jgi:riboflavin synthase
MFTGLVEDVGTVVGVVPRGKGKALQIRTTIDLSEVAAGDSIAVDGVCLTAETFHGDTFHAVAGRETLARTTLHTVRAGRRVHLERALALGDRLGGHLVQGHVDGTGRVTKVSDQQESWVVWVAVPSELQRYVAQKGSITVDGVSLTVNELAAGAARLNIVPHTAAVTRLGGLRPGDEVNLEVDVLAKYVERLLGITPGAQGGVTPELLRRYGYEGWKT